MTTQTIDLIQQGMVAGKKFKGMKFTNADFTGMDLKNADFRGCSLPYAKFVNADLTYAKFEGANLYHADFTDAVLHRTDFKEANLSCTIMRCKEMFGITITLECKSFQDMEASPGWWAGFIFYGLLMKPPSDEARDRLIQAMGLEYWETLRRQYASRRF